MTQATDYTKLTRENTSNGELQHIILVMEDKESEQISQFKRLAMDTMKRFLNKVQHFNRLAGIATVVIFLLFVVSAVYNAKLQPNTTEVSSQQEVSMSRQNISSKISCDSFHQLETQGANNATQLVNEHTVKRVDELKCKGDEKRKNINDLSKEVNATDQNTNYPHLRVERVDTELESLYE